MGNFDFFLKVPFCFVQIVQIDLIVQIDQSDQSDISDISDQSDQSDQRGQTSWGWAVLSSGTALQS